MIRYQLPFLLAILFCSSVQAQIIVERGHLWSKSAVIRPTNYKSQAQWGNGIQTALWIGDNYFKPTRFRLGMILGKRKTYLTRIFPSYTLENLSADVSRETNFFMLAALVDQRLYRYRSFDWTASGGLGVELQGPVLQTARMLPNGLESGTYTSIFYPIIKSSILLRSGLLYHISPRFTVGLEASYGTHLNQIFTKIDDKYAPHDLGLNLKVSYIPGRLRIPQDK